MSFNGAGLFLINTAGQPVVGNTLIDSTVFNTLTADLATGLSNVICKDGQSTPTANIPMGGFKLTGVALGTSNTDAATVQNVGAKSVCEGRLTVTSGSPVPTADTSSNTLYFTPYKGNRIALYDGTNWVMRTFAELSVSNASLSASKPFDVFVYDNAGTPAMEILVWTNDTTRATALTTQDGVYVKSGALTRRYVGTIYSTGGSQYQDAYANRWVWNYYNRVRRPARAVDTTDSWNYTLATLRQARATTTNQLDVVVGVAEDLVSVEVLAYFSNSNAGVGTVVGIGLDSISVLATGCLAISASNGGANYFMTAIASLKTIPTPGRHTFVWLEYSAATGTTTWYGDNGGGSALTQSGIHGEILA